MDPVSVKAVVRGPQGILFLKNPRNELELPGGRPDHGETLESALTREIEEECGLSITSVTYMGSQSCEIVPGRNVLLVFFYCTLPEGRLVLSDEHTAYEWVDLDAEPPHNMPSFYWEFCAQLRNDRNASEYAGAARPEYPLHTGEADRQRLMVTAQVYNAATTEFLRKFLPKIGRILEVGCGHGQIAQWLAYNAPEATVIGLDNDAEQISLARSAASAHGITNLSFRVGDLNDLASLSQFARQFELITCRFTLLHIGQRRPVIEALLDLLTPSGILVVEEPSLGSLFCMPPVAGFEQANAAISAYGESRGVNYNCIEDIWSIITKMNVQIRDARFSQPTVWKKEHKALVKLSFQQLSPLLVAHGILEENQAKRIEQSLDNEYMDDLVISGGLRTLQIAMSVKGRL